MTQAIAEKRRLFSGLFWYGECLAYTMLRIALACLILLQATIASAATSGFLLGFNYAEGFGFSDQPPTVVAVDGSNAIYMLGATYNPDALPATTALGQTSGPDSFVLKLSLDGKQIVYLTDLGFQASGMAVDAAGNVYIAGPDFVGKLNPAGTAWVYKTTISETVTLVGIAVDSAGHAYVVGFTNLIGGSLLTTPGAFQQAPPNYTSEHEFVVKLSADGAAFDYATFLTATYGEAPLSIAVDATGAAIISGYTGSPDFPYTPGAYRQTIDSNNDSLTTFLTRLLPDGSGLIYSAWPILLSSVPAAADSNGNAALVLENGQLLGLNPQGTLAFTQSTPGISALAMDPAGNTYALVNGLTEYIVSNSLFTCTPGFYAETLTVFDPGGNILQSTYLPHGTNGAYLGLGPNTQVYVVGTADTTFIATQTMAVAAGPLFLALFTPDPAAQPLQLACIANSASFYPAPIAAGEMVSLFGQGLGPAQGVQPDVTLASGFPNRVSDVQVTFNGITAPLLYVQDGQVNVIVPWEVANAPSVEICVSYFAPLANCLEWPLAEAAPGVFTVDGFYAAALNQDGTVNSASNPALAGTIVSVFATGLGPTNPVETDGAIVIPPLPVNNLPFQIFGVGGGIAFGYVPLETPYAGPAPYLVAGASQVNFVVTDTPLLLQNESNGSFAFASNGFTLYVSPN